MGFLSIPNYIRLYFALKASIFDSGQWKIIGAKLAAIQISVSTCKRYGRIGGIRIYLRKVFATTKGS
jgi:hypothetical protein